MITLLLKLSGLARRRKRFFFEKKKQKTFDCCVGDCIGQRARHGQKFFGSFFQKRTASFYTN
jgi:hypothetical protein